MKNTLGSVLTATLFGESHGEAVGLVLDGLPAGIPVSREQIEEALLLRRPQQGISTARCEPDEFSLVSGVYRGRTTGAPLCLLIPNREQRSSDYASSQILRPGHADFTAEMKYHGDQDPRGGGHFSGRVTAALVAGAEILRGALERRGVLVGTHLASVGSICDRGFSDPEQEIPALRKKLFAVLDPEAEGPMREEILSAAAAGDSVGGVLETCVWGMPAGVGEPWFDSLEGVLSHALFSIPAVKGVEFGLGFGFAGRRGSQANDAFRREGDRIVTATNHNGGINGGITNGMPVLFRTAVKPTPTISVPQNTVDLATGEETVLVSGGRHDPCIVPRARAVQDAVTVLVLADQLSLRYGTDFLRD